MSEHTVKDADADIRLDRWFKRHFPGVPHGLLEKNLRKGLIRVEGKKAKSSDRIQAGQVIKIQDSEFKTEATPAKPKSQSLKPEDVRLIQSLALYQDDHIIVVNKPAGLPVQGGNKIARSLDDLLDGLRANDQRPKLTHRLDRDTSGVLVLARNAKVANSLMHLFSGRKIEKTYLALVNNVPEQLSGTIDLPLLKKNNPKASAATSGRDYEIMQVDEEGQRAITEYRVVEFLARKFALMELKPLTGRTHQLRVHMQAIGSPIVGDHKYGGATRDAASIGVEDKLHLHAWCITIPSIAGGKKITVTAPLPKHMRTSFEALGIDIPKAKP